MALAKPNPLIDATDINDSFGKALAEITVMISKENLIFMPNRATT